MEHLVQYINCRELVRSQQSLVRNRRGIGQRVMSNCIVHHFFLSGVIPSLSLLLTTIIISSISIVILLCFNRETALISAHKFSLFPLQLGQSE